MNQPTQRIAIVGLGMALKPHLKSLRDLSDRVEIAAVWSPSEARRAQAVQEYNLPVAATLDAIFADASIQSILLLTPPMTHLDLVERSAASGKHVLLEKPLDVSVARAEKAVQAMQHAQRQLGIVLQHRFRAASLRLRQLVDAGELGRLVSASASIRWWRTPEYFAEPGRGMKDRDGGGVLLTQAIHTLDLFLSLTGPARKVMAYAANSGLRAIDTEDIVAGAVTFDEGVIGTLDATTVAYPGFPERIELACAQATAVLSGDELDVYFHDGRRLHVGEAPFVKDNSDPMSFSHEAHKALIADFLDAIQAHRPPAIDGRSALHVHRLIEALLHSAQTQASVNPADF
jgi:predicted dehydrogenase